MERFKQWWSERKTWQKVALVVVGLSVVLSPFTGEESAAETVAAVVEATTTTEAEATTTTEAVVEVPDVVGQRLSVAESLLDGYEIEVFDDYASRTVFNPSNWVVVSQEQTGGLIVLGVQKPDDGVTTTTKAPTTSEGPTTTTLPPAFLNMTVAEAADRWNQAADLLGSDTRITGTMPERDLVDGGKAHEWQFTETATLEVVAFGEDVQSVTFLTGASSDEAENLDVLIDIATWIVMVDPTLVETSRGEIFTALLENLGQGELDNEVVRNGVRYSASNLGPLLIFTAEPV